MKTRTVYGEIVNQIKELKKDSGLQEYLCETCTPRWASVLKRRVEIWREHNNPQRVNNFFHCLFGVPFEYYIVEKMGQIKNDGTNPWSFISWRGDKFIGTSGSDTFPASNSYPDLLYEYTNDDDENGFKKGDRVAIECKWTDLTGDNAEKCAIDKVRDCTFYLENALRDRACCFYLALGVGWDDEKAIPEAAYLIPASAIKNIDAKSIARYKIDEGPKINKEESLISTLMNEDDMANIVLDLQTQLDNLVDDLGLSD